MKKAVFPGSFDPFTIGHESIVRRAIPLFDEIIIAVGYNVNKKGYFSLEDRKSWIGKVFSDEPKIKVDHFEGLTINYCKNAGAGYLLRGLRTSADFEYERAIAQVNKAMYKGIETVFLLTMPEHTPVTSTIVRDIIRNGGDASKFLPKGMDINEKQNE
ncbi:MAG: pantetheine-phosphate adenylyltransferase [Bacteroidota bacterium]